MSPSASAIPHPLEQHQRVQEVLEKQIFFVVGCQKSGTTWVERLLNGHAEVVCRGEAAFGPVCIPIVQKLVKDYNAQQDYRNARLGPIDHLLMREPDACYVFAATAALMMSRWLEGDAGVIKCIGEKTPEHAMCLLLLDRAFPGMKVIHIIRDPRDVVVSGWFHNQRFNKERFDQQFPNMNAYATYLVKQHWLNYIDQAQAFGRAFPGRYYELRYEDLHTDRERITREMLGFLEVAADAPAVSGCLDAGSFGASADGRKEGEEDRSSFFRKGVVGDWQNHIDDATLNTITSMAGARMQALGYEI